MAEGVQVRGRVRMRTAAERLVCHSRLPLVAVVDADRPAVHVWDCGRGELRLAGALGVDSTEHAEFSAWERSERIPSVSWHPHEPLLVVAGAGDGVQQWSPSSAATSLGVPVDAAYRYVEFSPDGRTVWASPASGAKGGDWDRSDAVDLVSGAVRPGPAWDTGVATHPGGRLVLTWRSDQGATLGLFARVEEAGTPVSMHLLRRALILDADGYEAPLFSPDGRYIAVRGNAYENTLQVFEFPTLRQVLALTLGDPSPGYPYPPEWLEQVRSWSRHNLAFASDPGTLLVGTPSGGVIEIDLDTQRVLHHAVLTDSRVTALATVATGEVLVAGSAAELVLLAPLGRRIPDGSATRGRERVTAFLEAASELPDGADVETELVVTDGMRTWTGDDLEAITTATAADPTWLQIQAAMNAVLKQRD